MPLDKFIDVTNLKLDLWLVVPAIRFAFEIKIEKPALQFAAIVGVKMRPVLQPVAFKPLLCGSGSDKTFEIAARVQALPAPIGRRQKRHRDFAPVRRTRLMVIVVQRMSDNLVAEACAVTRERCVGQGLVAAHQRAGNDAARSSLPQTVLHGLDLHVVPVGPERREDATMMGHVSYQSAAPSQMHMAFKCGGWSEATCH